MEQKAIIFMVCSNGNRLELNTMYNNRIGFLPVLIENKYVDEDEKREECAVFKKRGIFSSLE